MIYDTLLNKFSKTMEVTLKLAEDQNRYIIGFDNCRFTLDLEVISDKPELKSIAIPSGIEENSKLYTIMSHESDFEGVFQEHLLEFTYALTLLNTTSFICDGRLHGLNIFKNNSTEYIYTFEYNKRLSRYTVLKHPKVGETFYLSPDETTYVAVPHEEYLKVVEQSKRLGTNAGIPPLWLKRNVVDGDFVYTPFVG